MIARQPAPRLWLVTDERQGEALWRALAALPKGSGVIFRHHAAPDRRALWERVRRIARARRLVAVLAGPPALAIAWRADGAHGSSRRVASPRALVRTAPAHDPAELRRAPPGAWRLVSPVFATRSHPGSPALGPVRLGLMIGRDRQRLIALGGITATRAKRLNQLGITAWAAIDGLTPG